MILKVFQVFFIYLIFKGHLNYLFLKRRTFTRLVSLGSVSLAFPSLLSSCEQIPPYDLALAQPRHLAGILDDSTLLAIGQEYRTQFPREGSEYQLVKALFKDLPQEKGQQIAYMDHLRQQDFASGEVVQVEGWVLSRTEARQCALISILQTQ